MSQQGVSTWPMIPKQAFLFFPAGTQIKEGQGEKQWRKIFQDGSPYDQFQMKKLNALDKQLQNVKFQVHPWFDTANKLRFLQANKFKIDDTCKSIKQGSLWRKKDFPLKANPQVGIRLNQGAMYFCGRDQQFRPILVVQIQKMRQFTQQTFPLVLNNLLEYAINNLLIPGQVQNYVLIINLDDAGLSDAGIVKKIVGFTSNTYRSRLYASYLLNTPFLIAGSWNSLASGLVSENTAKKIKISKKQTHEDMWKHIDRATVQKKYGGTMQNLTNSFWPPSQKLLTYISQNPKIAYITKQQYNKDFRDGKLKNRKVKQQLIQKIASPEPVPEPIINIQSARQNPDINQNVHRINNQANNSPNRIMPRQSIRVQTLPPIFNRNFKLFFQDTKFISILGKK